MTVALPRERRPVAALMAFEAVMLVVMSALHLGGILDDGTHPFDPAHAGIAEAVIAVALAGGTAAWLRAGRHARALAAAGLGFAIIGFGVGLDFTVRGGAAIDVGYHLVVLPLLLLTLALTIRRRGTAQRVTGARQPRHRPGRPGRP